MVEVVKSYEMVRTFNNFKASVTFAVKKPANMLILIRKNVFDYISPENFCEPPPPVDKFSGKIFYDLVKILAEVGQKKTTPPQC